MRSSSRSFFCLIVATALILFAATRTPCQKNDGIDNPSKAEKGGLEKPPSSDGERINALEESLRQQAAQLDELRKLISAQQATINLLAGRLGAGGHEGAVEEAKVAAATGAPEGSSGETAVVNANPQTSPLENRLKAVEERALKIGPFRFSGDFRLRFDGTFRPASKAPNPPLTHAQNARARYRLRLNFDSDLYPNLSFHGQLATGPINNPLTLDQDFSATTARHPFFISEAWIDYHPNKAVQLQGGRLQEIFADNSRFLFDDDIRFNGFNEKYVWSLKHKPLDLSSIEFRAGQYILTNPNVAIITPGSPLANAGQIVGSTGRSANLFHQGVLFNQQFNKKWSDQFGGDVQLYRNPNQIALASTNDGLVLLIQPGLGLALSGPLTGTGTATTTPGGAIYSARSFKIGRLTYRLNYSGFKHGDHMFPVTFNFQFARNMGTGLDQRDALLAAVQVGRITKRGDTSYLYVYAIKGANSMISQVTDDDLGTGTGVNIHTNYFRFEYGIAKKVTFQSLVFIQSQIRNSAPNFFVPLGAFAPRTYRLQQQLVFSF
ncbi:MAG TPA: putative porin [Pyrinomonadaceae bacterium]|nr:putative porin [Pyrinomonadaceae bacterium]